MSDDMLDLAASARWDDPFVAEVRATRAAIWAEVGQDLDRLFDRILEIEAAERAAGRAFIDAPVPAARPGVAA